MAIHPTSSEWARIANTTLAKVLNEEEVVARKRAFLGLVMKRGNLVYNQGGDGFTWPIMYRRAPMESNNGEQTLSFSRQNRWKNAALDFVGLAATDAVTRREMRKNRGKEAIVKWTDKLGEKLTADMRDQFEEELYIDSSATGNSQRMTGLESMFAATQTINITSGAARTANAADPCGYPNDTYAGLSTVLATHGGSWGTQSTIDNVWPFGRGKPEYDAWSPVLINYTSTAFDGSSTTWEANCVRAVRFGLEAVNGRNKLNDGQIELVTLDRGLYRKYKDKLDSKERIAISADNELRALGFAGTDGFEQDGATIMPLYGMPGAIGYGINIKAVELRMQEGEMFTVDGPEFDLPSQTWRTAVTWSGQAKFASPRSFFKLVAIA
jgi:hypothetical protein